MSRYDMEEAGLTDPVGSKSPPEASRRAEALADLDPEDRRPESSDVIIMDGKDHLDRLVYAIRLAITLAPPGFPIHYWAEEDYLAQLARLDERRRWSFKSGDVGDVIGEYEVNRSILKEMEDVSYLIFDGLNGETQEYRFGEVRAITELLIKRMRDPQCFTFVVPAVSSLPEFYKNNRFREIVAPRYELFAL